MVFTEEILTTRGHVPAGGFVRALMPGNGVVADRVRLTNVTRNDPLSVVAHYLQFSEVEVIQYGAAREVNLAPYGTITMSSMEALLAGGAAVDGSTDGLVANGSVARTQSAPGSWLRIDLGPLRVDEIRLWPGTWGQSRCGNFRVEVLSSNVVVWGQNVLPGALMPLTGPTVVTPPPGTNGDAVRITTLGPVNGGERLEFAEVEILQFSNLRASHTPFGAGCADAASVPVLLADGWPVLGSQFETLVRTAQPAPSLAVLAHGLSNQQASGLPLPLSLAVLGAPGCAALNSLDVTQIGAVAAAMPPVLYRWLLTISNVPAFAGVQLFTQAYVLDAGANSLGVAVSNAARLVTGT